MEKIQNIAEIIGYICVIATMVAALIPNPNTKTKIGKVVGVIHKLIKMLPTIGINPDTRILEEKLKAKEEK